jgi:FAD/FMN-containing dehydrogenase
VVTSRRTFLAGASAAAGVVALPSRAAGGTAEPGATTVTPADPRYPDLVRGLNQRWVGSPARVHLVTSTDDVVDAVGRAVRAGEHLSVRSGGHCFEDFVYRPGVDAVIDLSAMDAVRFDPVRGAFEVQAGARLLDVYETLYRRWGVVLPAGICYTVGAGGHVPGGGWGLLSRRHGLAVDHLAAVEVVVVDASGTARAVVATADPADPHHDLWWAHTGGGGGSFGVVTRFWFRTPGAAGTPATALPAPPAEVFVASLAWPWERMTEAAFTALVDNFGRWHEEHAGVAEPEAGICALVSLTHRAGGRITATVQADATAAGAEEALAGFLAALRRDVPVEPVVSPAPGEEVRTAAGPGVRRLPWLQAARWFGTTDGALNDPSARMDYKSSFLRRRMPLPHIAALYRHLSGPDGNPTAMVQLHSFGGRVSAVPQDATAYAHRDAIYNMIWYAQWHDPAEDAANLRWIRQCYEDVYAATGGVPVPDDVTDGCYVNYPDIDLGDPARNRSGVPWHTLYHKDNHRRLQRVKAAWDPLDAFRHGQSVRPR